MADHISTLPGRSKESTSCGDRPTQSAATRHAASFATRRNPVRGSLRGVIRRRRPPCTLWLDPYIRPRIVRRVRVGLRSSDGCGIRNRSGRGRCLNHEREQHRDGDRIGRPGGREDCDRRTARRRRERDGLRSWPRTSPAPARAASRITTTPPNLDVVHLGHPLHLAGQNANRRGAEISQRAQTECCDEPSAFSASPPRLCGSLLLAPPTSRCRRSAGRLFRRTVAA